VAELLQRPPLKAVTYYRTGLTLFSPGASAIRSAYAKFWRISLHSSNQPPAQSDQPGRGQFLASRRFGRWSQT